MGVSSFKELMGHVGHDVGVVTYRNATTGEHVNVAIECFECNTVLLDFDKDGDTDDEITSFKVD